MAEREPSVRCSTRQGFGGLAALLLLLLCTGCGDANTLSGSFGQTTEFRQLRVQILVTVAFQADGTFVRTWYVENGPVKPAAHKAKGRTKGRYTKVGDQISCSDGCVYKMAGNKVLLLKVGNGSMVPEAVAARVIVSKVARSSASPPPPAAGAELDNAAWIIPGWVARTGDEICELVRGKPGTVFDPPLPFTRL